MHLHWEKTEHYAGDCHVRSLTWMGRVPEQIPQDEGWKLNRALYYQEGWLATANVKGIVGVTFTSSHYNDNENLGDSVNVHSTTSSNEIDSVEGSYFETPSRLNYNLRGHRSEVTLVRWNEPYQKLASCDKSGIIFVWIKYEGRWSIELINDRSTPVVCFSWSHDGRMALICYQDGFVLVGSVAGQRFWSTQLPTDTQRVTAATWTPDDQQVYLGTSQGGILVMDVMGNTVGLASLREGVPIADLAWSCERFNMEESTLEVENDVNATRVGSGGGDEASAAVGSSADGFIQGGKTFVLAASFRNGEIMLLRTYDDVIPQVIETGMTNISLDWSNSGSMLAVGGKVRELACRSDHTFKYVNAIKFYASQGHLIYQSEMASHNCPVTSLTWGHNDKRLFVATGNQIHVGWVSSQIASLQLLSRLKIHSTLSQRDHVHWLPLPCRIQNLIASLFASTIKSCVPTPSKLLDFVTKPHSDGTRFHCTMVRHISQSESRQTGDGEEGNGEDWATYTLYLEHLGGFLPLLKGKKVSKIRPDFIIFDPNLKGCQRELWTHLPPTHSARQGHFSTLDIDDEEDMDLGDQAQQTSEQNAGNQSPRSLRRNQSAQRTRTNTILGRRRQGRRLGLPDDLDLINILPEEDRIAEVTANFWGTKFQITSHYLDLLPPCLGQIVYRASLLHLQPRQMRLELTDLRVDDSDPFGDSFWAEHDDGVGKDEGTGEDGEDDEFATLHQGVSMKDNLLKAVTAEHEVGDGQHFKNDPAGNEAKVAVVAPLTTRLSFIAPATDASAINTPHAETVDVQHLRQQFHSSPVCRAAGPSKTVDFDATAIVENESVSGPSNKAVVSGKMNDSYKMDSVPQTMVHHQHPQHLQLSSPAKRRLKMSLSCDNYLGDAKLSLSRRDSVGSGSPHSSKGSPRRWAAKVEEMATPTVEKQQRIPTGGGKEDVMAVSAMAELGAEVVSSAVIVSPTRPNRSSSLGDGLDAIVDLLGVPSDLVPPSDLNKRLVLLKESENEEADAREDRGISRDKTKSCGGRPPLEKSKSCEAVKRRKRRRRKDESRHNIELKRRSLYGRDECKGRSEDKTCQRCADVAIRVDDAKLNEEIFDVVVNKKPDKCQAESDDDFDVLRKGNVCDTPKLQRKRLPPPEAAQRELDRDDLLVALEKCDIDGQPSFGGKQDERRVPSNQHGGRPQPALMPAIRENIPAQSHLQHRRRSEQQSAPPASQMSLPPCRSRSHGPPDKRDRSSSGRRRFDSVRNLLEKARSILAFSRTKFRSREHSREGRSKDAEKAAPAALVVPPPPCTPAVNRRNDETDEGEIVLSNVHSSPNTPAPGRHRPRRQRSFSPMRAIMNSPLLRRKKQSIDSSEEELLQPGPEALSGVTLDGEEAAVEGGRQAECEGPQRSSFKDLETFQKQQLRHKLKKRNDDDGKCSEGVTPSPTPTQFLSPFLPRRAAARMASPLFNRRHQQPQAKSKGFELPRAPPPVTVRKRRKLILTNKAPMWNENNQVYQLDFGGRVTQESAKNFQIEYKDKQVMQFGRIGSNAYTLDFQYPFTALQAFGVALANVTQRLK